MSVTGLTTSVSSVSPDAERTADPASWTAAQRRLYSRVEDAGLNASAPPQQRWLDGWLVRFSPGKAQRARCVNAVASGLTPLDAKLDAVRQVFDEASLPLIVRITPFSQPAGLDQALAERGWVAEGNTCVMVCHDLQVHRSTPDSSVTRAEPSHRIESIGTQAFAQVVGQLRGSPLSQRQAHAQRLELSPVPFTAFVLRGPGDSTPLACGQIAVEGEMAGLYDVYTAESARGQGLATVLCEHLLRVAAAQPGVTTAYLQVEADNHAARRIYRRQRFVDAYRYHYRTAPPSQAGKTAVG